MGAMAPKAVATPFPPLNPKKTGQMCPRQAAMAIKPSQKGLTPNSYAPQTGNIPFRTSKISTATAAPLPPIRNTLVAPDCRSRWFADGQPTQAANQNGTGNGAAEVRDEDHSRRDCTHKLFRFENSCSTMNLWIIRTFRRKWYPVSQKAGRT